MHKLLFIIGISLCLNASAQLPEDALRASWTTPGGTAREQAIGGAMGSLGGDLTAAFVNPAGLGVYKTRELVLSPGWRFLNDKGSYLGQTLNGPAANRFSLGTSGLVLGYEGVLPGVNNAFAISVNQTADFNSHVLYQGANSYSSFAEQYAEEFAYSGLDINGGLASPSLDYGTRMALWTSLIDTATVNGTLQVIAQPQKAGKVLQRNDLRSTGGITEIAISLASNYHGKWYVGGSLGIPILNYTRYQTYTETDASGNTNNDFESFTYSETYRTMGAGVNLKGGLIFAPSAPWRIGLAIHTPSVLGLTDRISAAMTTRTEAYTNLKEVSVTSQELDETTGLAPPPNSFNYRLYTPWHFLVSGSYIFGSGQANAKDQKGFVTADLEYITTHDPHFSAAASEDGSGDPNSIYDGVNEAIKETYKGTISARLGGEMKFDTWMVRAGGAYYTNPYKYSGVKADKLFLSTGVGYRKKAFFADLTYVARFSRDIHVPYYLADKANTAATLKEMGGTVILTFGIKL
ncbi:MAG TPA: hypothetical protein VHE34_15865 [Puia sp.]|uniref:hypothetical protein n=1 Tax=Puia sp. TaxID=2045100 RepID=UPI002BCD64B8|nr:hypothetical protein [Puia sp.]HVU96706.1 hypothetical protein [Puia sp.]